MLVLQCFLLCFRFQAMIWDAISHVSLRTGVLQGGSGCGSRATDQHRLVYARLHLGYKDTLAKPCLHRKLIWRGVHLPNNEMA